MKVLKRLSVVLPGLMPALCDILWWLWKLTWGRTSDAESQISILKNLLNGCPWWARGHLLLGEEAARLNHRELAINSAEAVFALINSGRAKGEKIKESAKSLISLKRS